MAVDPERKRQQRRAADRRRRERIAEQNKVLPKVECQCGCGLPINALTRDGRPARFNPEHVSRALAVGRVPSAPAVTMPKLSQTPPCRYEGAPEIFFSREPSDIAAAKGLCGRCPVRQECLNWALARGEAFGVWGGLDADERRLLDAGRLQFAQVSIDRHSRREEGRRLLLAGREAKEVAEWVGVDERTAMRWRASLKKEGALT